MVKQTMKYDDGAHAFYITTQQQGGGWVGRWAWGCVGAEPPVCKDFSTCSLPTLFFLAVARVNTTQNENGTNNMCCPVASESNERC